ncbi:MAG: hypothetical protein LBM98_00225 [Oscillospiraceae bacterium]|nr:hypothetical protein [Oscillospiraceae bacterium]
MLRTCNALRIASLPVLRNDGAGFALAPAPRPTSKPPQLFIVHCSLFTE